jgi:hypothetical protein
MCRGHCTGISAHGLTWRWRNVRNLRLGVFACGCQCNLHDPQWWSKTSKLPGLAANLPVSTSFISVFFPVRPHNARASRHELTIHTGRRATWHRYRPRQHLECGPVMIRLSARLTEYHMFRYSARLFVAETLDPAKNPATQTIGIFSRIRNTAKAVTPVICSPQPGLHTTNLKVTHDSASLHTCRSRL